MGMTARKHDLLRIAFVTLVSLASLGYGLLRPVDVENLAMKSTGTLVDREEALRDRDFGKDPSIGLLALPRAPEFVSEIDLEELGTWADLVRNLPDVSAAHTKETGPGELALVLRVHAEANGHYADAVKRISNEARAALPATYRLSITGTPVIEIAISRALASERARILPILVTLLFVVLLAIYRVPGVALGVLLAPLAGIALVEGLAAALGYRIDPVSGLLGPAILTVGVAAGVHYLEGFRRRRESGQAVHEACRSAGRDLRLPFVLTVGTTVAGFLGLTLNPLPAVRRFGLFASLGVAVAYLVTVFVLPSVLRLAGGALRFGGAGGRRGALLLSRWSARRAGILVGISCVAGLVLASGWWRVGVDNDPLEVLPPRHEVRLQSGRIGRRLGGTEVFELWLGPGVTAPSPWAVAALIQKVTALEGVAGSADEPRWSESGAVLVTFLIERGSAVQRERLFQRAEEIARGAGWNKVNATGIAVRMARDSSALLFGQRRSIVVTILCLWAVMAFGLSSWKLATLGLVPNVLPLVVLHGSLGLAHVPMTVATSMIGTVMLGLVVDDTIHMLVAYRRRRASEVRPIASALCEVARPIVLTTVVLCAGFLATSFGTLSTTVEFGLSAIAILVLALFSDLLLLPAILTLVERRQKPLVRAALS